VEKLIIAHLVKKFSGFIELGSLPSSQESISDRYPGPDEPNPQPHTLCTIYFSIILPFYLRIFKLSLQIFVLCAE